MVDRSFNLFGLNAPAWSLFWEYIANICYAFILYRLNKRVIYWLIILAAVLLGNVAYRSGNLLGGWAGDNFWHGGSRIFYSFLAGLLIYRNQWIIRNKLGFAGLTELLVVFCYFPLLVSLGAGTGISPRVERICDLSGRVSYPLYMTHYSNIWIFGNYFLKEKPAPADLIGLITCATIGLVFFAFLVMKLYYEPVRRYLSK